MLEPTQVAASGERFLVAYEVQAGGHDMAAFARWMAGEMTVEFPLELIPDDGISQHVVGRVEDVQPMPHGCHLVRISVAVEVVAGSLTQLLSVVWGNVGLAPGVRLVELDLPEAMVRALGGPAHGLAGWRELAGAPKRPLLMSAVKPLGLPVGRLAAIGAELAAGGLDVIKEDQSLADQGWAPFADRVGPIAEAIATANERHGTRAVYAPSLNAPVEDIPRRAAFARDAGAGAVMVQPGISGYPVLAAAASAAGLPVIAHPGGLGGFSERMAHGLVFGTLPRLAGADCSVFIIPGGRFDVAEHDARAIVAGCLEPLAGAAPILPAAGGGVTVEKVPLLREAYGDDLCLLIGGDLHRDGNPRRRAEQLRSAVSG